MPKPKPPASPPFQLRQWSPYMLIVAKGAMGLWLAIGVAIAIFLAVTVMKARATRGWSLAEATIVKSDVKPIGQGKNPRYRVEVSYRYRLYDVDYTGTRLRYVNRSEGDLKAAESLAAQLKPGTTVDVYYDPLERASAVLFPGASTQDYVDFWLPAAMLAIGLFLYYWIRRTQRWLLAAPPASEPAKKPTAKW